MIKKPYLTPTIIIANCTNEPLLNGASINAVSGNTGIQRASEDMPIPDEAYSKSTFCSWDDGK